MSELVVAVTRNGLGDFWSFECWQDAWDHALIQYGDVILQRKEDITKQYMRHELPDLIRRVVGDKTQQARIYQGFSSGDDSNSLSLLWSHVRSASSPAPTDPAFICNQVRIDRNTPTNRNPRGTTMTTTAAPKAKKESTGPRPPKYNPESKITLLKDKDGKQYDKDNNPKRPGSSSHGRFAAYVNGMTVKAANDAGITSADLDNDTKKGFISVA